MTMTGKVKFIFCDPSRIKNHDDDAVIKDFS